MGESSTKLSIQDFIRRSSEIKSIKDTDSLRKDAVATENLYRELFARKRESWEIPEIDDTYHFLLDVYNTTDCFKCLPRFEDDVTPRCFELEKDKRLAAGELGIVPTRDEFDVSWDCLTEGLLRFVDWKNVCAAGGAVAGCLARLPPEVAEVKGIAAQRVKRRKYFHDTYLPGSDIDLFLYGIDEAQAEKKLLEIYDAVQAANPYPVRAFRSAHAITLVSQYPFRHVQIVLRLYNSPSEVLMGFDVDSCAVGFDGSKVLTCPRTAMAIMTQSNLVDMSRRSPSYEMRLSKYATRGFEVLVPSLDRDRVDPFLYEKRFDQAKGLSRLLLLEKLRTPEERLRYKLEGQLKTKGRTNWALQRRLRKMQNDRWTLNRAEGIDNIVPPPPTGAAEMSNYSTIFLPWGPDWSAKKCEWQALKKDKMLNKIEFTSDGRVVQNRRQFKIHLCAVGTMEEVIANPFPDDPPIPDDIPSVALESIVRGKVTWLVDNPGRQQIGSFHPITDEDWTDGAYFTHSAELLTKAAVTNNIEEIAALFAKEKMNDPSAVKAFITSKDFLGRSSLHLATLSRSIDACKLLLEHPLVDADYLQARLPDGRMALHLAAMKGDEQTIKLILEKRRNLAMQLVSSSGGTEEDKLVEVLDIDAADWEVKINPLQYAISLGHVEIVRTLLEYGANARKIAVQKDENKSYSTLTLLTHYASECGKVGISKIKPILELLLEFGASFTQVDTTGKTCWHHLAVSNTYSACSAFEIFMTVAKSRRIDKKIMALDVLDKEMSTALYIATAFGNEKAVDVLLLNGATPVFTEEDWEKRVERVNESKGRSNYYYNKSENTRCPFWLATTRVDVPALKAFLRHYTSLANFSLQLPALYSFQTSYYYYSSYNRGNSTQTGFRPLDILERARSTVLGSFQNDDNSHVIIRQKEALKKLEATKKRLKRAETCRDNAVAVSPSSDNSYESFIWPLVVKREQVMLKLDEGEIHKGESLEETEIDKQDAIKQIDEAYKVIKEAGGEPHPKENIELEEINVNKDSSGVISPKVEESNLYDPFDEYNEMNADRRRSSYYYNHDSKLSEVTRKKMNDLMVEVSLGNIKQIENTIAFTKVSFYNKITLTTPLFLAVEGSRIDAVEIIIEAGIRHFQRYVKKQRELQLKEKLKEEELNEGKRGDGDMEKIIKDQVRRLNNLDIAAGETPKSDPTPDEIRLKLEAAEAAAIEQAPLEQASDEEEWEISKETVSSSITPETMLLYRSIILPDGPLLELKNRIKLTCPKLPDEWVGHAVKLRPIELAVIRSDLEMVTELLTRAEEICSTLSTDLDEPCEKDEDEDEKEDGTKQNLNSDADNSNDDDSYEDDHCSGNDENRILPSCMTLCELRYELTGRESKNSDLADMTLIELAVMMDNVPILSAILSFAREYALPRSSIGLWKAEVDKLNDMDCNEEIKKKRKEETALIKSDTTPILHFALNFGCKLTTKALMLGELDDPLLSWIVNKPYTTKRNEDDSLMNYNIKGTCAAATWVCLQVFESKVTKADLAKKLVRPTALDEVGRTALFCTPTNLVSEVIDSAVQTITSTENKISSSDAKSSFLETLTTNGFSVLMAAAATGDIDKVKTLLNAGVQCSTRTNDDRKWNAIHMALTLKRDSTGENSEENDSEAESKRWTTVRDIIELIIESASDTDLDELLLCPDSDHTPLMLAASRSADEGTIAFLAGKTALRAVEGLARYDNDMNSTLHIAVKKAIKNSVKTRKLDSIGVLLKQPDSPNGLGPNTENARGMTPTEMALEAVVAVWRDTTKNLNSKGLWSKKGLFMIPPKIQLVKEECDTNKLSSFNRQLLYLLISAESEGRLSRVPVSFTDVQQNKKNATERVRNNSNERESDNDMKEYQSKEFLHVDDSIVRIQGNQYHFRSWWDV